MSRRFTLYVREGCHLCDAFLEELQSHGHAPLDFISVDVDSDPVLSQRFGSRVPLLCLGEEVICEYFYDQEKVSGHVN